MASARSWLGSVITLLVFFIARRWCLGFATPSLLAVLFACTYIWFLVLRIPEFQKSLPDPEMRSAEEDEEVCAPPARRGEEDAAAADSSNPEVQQPAEVEAGAEEATDVAALADSVEGVAEQTPATGSSDQGIPDDSAKPAEPAVDKVPQSPAEPAAEDHAASENDEIPDWGEDSDRDSEAEKADAEQRRRAIEEERADPEKAQELRLQGNELFKAGKLHDAREAYSEALYLTPPSQDKDKAVLHCNRAACLQKLSRWEDVITDCAAAIKLDSEYTKAYVRRSAAYEALEKWHDSLEDLKKAIELDPQLRSKEYKRQAVLEKRAQDQFEKDKDEMMGKLKELGNTVLGKFGMSCDNFKLEQDPNTGGYSIKFQQ